MATKFFRDNDGNYIGGYDGAEPPEGSIEVSVAPQDARYKWDGNAWIEPAPLKDVFVEEKIEAQVVNQGVTLEDKVNALWLKANGDDSEFKRIDDIIKQAEVDNPKALEIAADPI